MQNSVTPSSQPEPLRLFQVNLPIAAGPQMVAARGLEHALEIALAGRPRSGLRGAAMIWDATDEWGSLSLKALGHTALLLASDLEGIVAYDDEIGWRVLNDHAFHPR